MKGEAGHMLHNEKSKQVPSKCLVSSSGASMGFYWWLTQQENLTSSLATEFRSARMNLWIL
ncbi:FAXDC2 isoform 5 [Pan troglodytes]|uniref:Fatty acid hydroxylase domain containing 2 n=2 Tax=Homininae TaxID=207598 RepID=E5RJQ9_HUMAN|nr:fatty acid hydroxylase domain containing 2 [Homo sapiens]KAI4023617.1 fatty acid hydroxylase domain containing 2 [Homo sapiens]PNI72122.1 FAXDC2 isoform 5 [Pan troglodytes]